MCLFLTKSFILNRKSSRTLESNSFPQVLNTRINAADIWISSFCLQGCGQSDEQDRLTSVHPDSRLRHEPVRHSLHPPPWAAHAKGHLRNRRVAWGTGHLPCESHMRMAHHRGAGHGPHHGVCGSARTPVRAVPVGAHQPGPRVQRLQDVRVQQRLLRPPAEGRTSSNGSLTLW